MLQSISTMLYSNITSYEDIENLPDHIVYNWIRHDYGRNILTYGRVSRAYRSIWQEEIKWDGSLVHIYDNSIFYYVTEELLREFQEHLDWDKVWMFFKSSNEDFIEEIAIKYGGWKAISTYQELSEKFIDKHKFELDWEEISRCQKLSKPFIRKHAKDVVWDMIIRFQDSWIFS